MTAMETGSWVSTMPMVCEQGGPDPEENRLPGITYTWRKNQNPMNLHPLDNSWWISGKRLTAIWKARGFRK
jgi:hypothetical protein